MSICRILCVGMAVGAVLSSFAFEAPTASSTRRPATATKFPVSQGAQSPLIGLVVLSSDGGKIGTIESVDGETDGRISAINVLTGSFLGVSTRVVAIPEGKFTRNGESVQVSMTAEEVAKLPSAKDKV